MSLVGTLIQTEKDVFDVHQKTLNKNLEDWNKIYNKRIILDENFKKMENEIQMFSEKLSQNFAKTHDDLSREVNECYQSATAKKNLTEETLDRYLDGINELDSKTTEKFAKLLQKMHHRLHVQESLSIKASFDIVSLTKALASRLAF